MACVLCVTQWHCDVITHSEQLSETNDFILRRNANFFHLFDGESNGIFVMWCNHDTNFLGIFTFVFHNLSDESKTILLLQPLRPVHWNISNLYSAQTFGQCLVIHLRGRFEAGINWIFVAKGARSSTFLFHVRAADQFCAKVEILTFRLLQIHAHLSRDCVKFNWKCELDLLEWNL